MTASERSAAAAWSQRTTWVLVAIGLSACATLPLLVHPHFEARNDACMYILVARSMLTGEGYSLLGEPFALRPPGFSALLMPVLALAGTDFHILNLFTASFGVVALLLFFVWVRPRIGTVSACVSCAVLWFNPLFRTLSNQVMSDIPGLALLLLCVLVERSGRERPATWKDGMLGLCIGAAAMLRTANALFLPALFASRLFRPREGKRGRSLITATVMTLAVLAPWSWRNTRVELTSPAEQTDASSYWTGMLHEDPGDPASPRYSLGDVAARVPAQVANTLSALGGQRGSLWLGLAGMACVALVLALRREPAEWMALATLAFVALWFTFLTRFVLTLYVLVLPAVVEVLQLLARRFLPERAATAGVSVLLAAWIGFNHPTAPDPTWRKRMETMEGVAAAINKHVPPDVPLAARVGWELGVYLEGRRVYSR